MEYTQDEIFNIKYNKQKNRIETKKIGMFQKIGQAIRNNKFITMVVVMAIMMSIINSIMISNFFILLSSL